MMESKQRSVMYCWIQNDVNCYIMRVYYVYAFTFYICVMSAIQILEKIGFYPCQYLVYDIRILKSEHNCIIIRKPITTSVLIKRIR